MEHMNPGLPFCDIKPVTRGHYGLYLTAEVFLLPIELPRINRAEQLPALRPEHHEAVSAAYIRHKESVTQMSNSIWHESGSILNSQRSGIDLHTSLIRPVPEAVIIIKASVPGIVQIFFGALNCRYYGQGQKHIS